MSKKNNHVTVNRAVVTRASRLLECRIRDALNEHFGCPCSFYWVTSALPVLQGQEAGIIIEIHDEANPTSDASALVSLSVSGELKLIITQKRFENAHLKSISVETKTVIRLQ